MRVGADLLVLQLTLAYPGGFQLTGTVDDCTAGAAASHVRFDVNISQPGGDILITHALCTAQILLAFDVKHGSAGM